MVKEETRRRNNKNIEEAQHRITGRLKTRCADPNMEKADEELNLPKCSLSYNNIDFYLAHNHESISMRCTIQISIQNKNKTYMQYYS